jgi:hypothetical protein
MNVLIGKRVHFERVLQGRLQHVCDVVEWVDDTERYFRLREFGHFGLGTLHPETDRIVSIDGMGR